MKKKDYIILEAERDVEDITLFPGDEPQEIISLWQVKTVKRILDGMIVSLGDWVTPKGENRGGEVIRMWPEGEKMRIVYKNGEYTGRMDLMDISGVYCKEVIEKDYEKMSKEKKTAESVLAKARANNEPVFVLRAQDKLAVYAIRSYLEAISIADDKVSLSHYYEVEKIFTDFVYWKVNNETKFPD